MRPGCDGPSCGGGDITPCRLVILRPYSGGRPESRGQVQSARFAHAPSARNVIEERSAPNAGASRCQADLRARRVALPTTPGSARLPGRRATLVFIVEAEVPRRPLCDA